ncbi:MAG: PKD domain-containing protein [Bacteroidota bacterium]
MKKLLISTVLLYAVLNNYSTAQVIQLTNNSTIDQKPRVSGNYIIWQGSDGSDNEIYLYDIINDTTIQLTNNALGENDPEISGNKAVWWASVGGNYEIFYYDGASVTQVTNNSVNDWYPRISGNNAVWYSNADGDYEIYLYDGATTTQITNNTTLDEAPIVSGNYIAWKGDSAGTPAVMLHDLTIPQTDQISFASFSIMGPQDISGNQVIWVDGYQGWEVRYFNGTGTSNLSNSFNIVDSDPRISGNNIVWWDDSGNRVWLYDGATSTILAYNAFSPEVSGNNVIWLQWDGNDNELFLLTGDTTVQLTDDSYNMSGGSYAPRISGNVVVWGVSDGSDNEIFMYIIPSASFSADDTTVCAGDSIVFTNTSMDATSYIWKENGITFSTETNVTRVFSTPGIFTISLIALDTFLTDTFEIDITVFPTPSLSTTVNDVSCNGGEDGEATGTPSGGTPSYNYTWYDSTMVSLGQPFATAYDLSAGTYIIEVSDANICFAYDTALVSEPQALTTSLTGVNATCNGSSDGSADLTVSGGTPPYSYNWSTGDTAQDISGLPAGVDSVVVTDANGCIIDDGIAITEPPVVSSSFINTDVSCYGGNDASVDLTVSPGTPPYLFSWSNGDTLEDPDSLTAGIYSVVITDSAGCMGYDTVNISEPAALTIDTIAKTDVNCKGGSTGSATANVSGGTGSYTYSWNTSPPQTLANATGMAAGIYILTVTDANACITADSVTINEPATLTTYTTQTNISCNGLDDGTATVTPTGGTTPYNYLWNPSAQTDSTATGLSPGIYTIDVTDANGCQTTPNVTITEPSPLTSVTSWTNATCGNSDGIATVNAAGGTIPYTYTWSSGSTDPTATGLTAGNYTVTITDNNGCSSLDSVIIDITAPTQQICIVTVDSTSTKNIVVWEKPVTTGIDSFRIYREIPGPGYVHIGSVPYDSLSEFIDTTNGINPQITSYRYKLTVVDSCGNESDTSDYHETIHLTPPTETGGDVTLIWDNYEGFGFNYYRILRDSLGTGNFEAIDSVTNSNFTYTDINAPVGVLNYVIEIVHVTGCMSTIKGKNYNSSKSNTTSIATESAPVASFTANTTSIAAGGSVNFTDLSTNSPTSWSWTFTGGIPSSSTVQNPTNIVYNDTGCYEVKLVATNIIGSDSLTETCYIDVSSPVSAPVAGFTADTTSILPGGSVNFTDLSTNNPTSWSWTFTGGSPSSSTLQNPTNIVYNDTGCYEVKLVATNIIGSDSLTETCYIDVSPPGSAPVADFTADTTSILAGGSVNFTDLSTNNPTSWSWTFTGGTPSSSTVQNPSNIVYNNTGCYEVKLAATNIIGSDSLTETCYIDVSPVGMDELQVSCLKFKVYPNPNKGVFNLALYLEEKENIKIEIFDMQGQLICSERTGRISGFFNKEINISGYRGSIYHLQVITKEGVINKKIVIE